MADVLAEASRYGSRTEVTFDDGNASDVEEALPALLERGLRAVFNVCAGRIGQPGYLDAGALAQLREAGMVVGSHGWNHVDLRGLPEADLVQETQGSRRRIAEVSGMPVSHFAVPFGSYDRRVLRHLRNYPTVYTSDSTSVTRPGWVVPRWSYTQSWTPTSLRRLADNGGSIRRRSRQRGAMLAKRWR